MSMNDLENALQLIDAHAAVADFAGPKPEQLIKNAETALGLAFPPTYRKFLNHLGAGAVGSVEFYGVIKDEFKNSSVPDGIWLTLDERRSSHLPNSLVVIGSTGDGGYYAIDRSQVDAADESPVVEWWPGLPNAGGNRRTVATDFGSFLLQQVQEFVGRHPHQSGGGM